MDPAVHAELTRSRRDYLAQEFSRVRSQTEVLCLPLVEEDYMLSVTEETSPVKWHLAHTTWFFEHFILEVFVPGYECFRPAFNFLFNSYYKRVGEYLPKSKRAVLSRPSTDEVKAYRHFVTASVSSLLMESETDGEQILEVLEIGLNHEQQHQELLLMDVKRNFFENPLRPKFWNETPAPLRSRTSEFVKFHAGLVSVGHPTSDPSFAYDNEKDQHKVWLESFELSSQLVTNGEFLAFIEDGGYMDPQYWLSDGWDFKEKERWTHPLYWERDSNGTWTVMTLSGTRDLDPLAPVTHVSYYEASAFAKWMGCRLPSEEEWETAARLEPVRGEFLDAKAGPTEVFADIHGSVWEWTTSAYQAYPRFQALSHGMSEYNEKFMCNQFVLRGGSAVTPISHYRLTYRNFYYPHMRWMYAGIRLAKEVL